MPVARARRGWMSIRYAKLSGAPLSVMSIARPHHARAPPSRSRSLQNRGRPFRRLRGTFADGWGKGFVPRTLMSRWGGPRAPLWLVGGPRAAPEMSRKKKMATGTVKWFNDAKGFGFIKQEG